MTPIAGLAVLLIEDSESDAALMLRELSSKGYQLRHLRVESAAELRSALADEWDVILSDFRLPQFNAITALEILQATGRDIPFIIVSQAIGEGVAVELMRSGAVDYVMKSSLKRLAPAIDREVREARIRAQSRRDAVLLAEQNQRFRDLVDSSPGIVWEADAQSFRFLSVSLNCERIFGYPSDQWLEPGFWSSHIHHDDRDQAVNFCQQQTRQLIDHAFEYRFERADGKHVWVQDMVKVLHENGKPRFLRGLMVDITERKRAENQLKAQEMFLNSVIESQINGVVVVSKSGEITVVNESAAEILEFERDQVIGRNFLEADHWKQIDHDYYPIPADKLPLAIALGQKKSVRNYEHAIQLPDGTTKWLNVSASPILDTGGELVGAVASFIDVSEQHTVRQKMVRQLERLRLQEKAINSSMSGVIIADARLPDLPVTFINDAFTHITGYEPRDVIGRNCRFLQGPDSNQNELARMREALKKREAGEFILRNYRKDGSLFHSKLQLAPVKNDKGDVTHFVGLQTDITEKFVAEKQLELARERMELALRGAQLGLLDIDYVNQTIFYSPRFAEILGYTIKELKGQFSYWTELVHPEDLEQTKKIKQDHLAGQIENLELEMRMLHKNGNAIWILLRGRVVERSPDGRPLRFTGTILDINESKAQTQKIMELSQQMLNISEVERSEISSELHDVIGQSLVLLKLNLLKFLRDNDLRTADNEKTLLEPVADTLDKVRDISRRLTPSHMKKVGLQLAVEDMLESAEALSGIRIEADLAALDGFFPDNWSIPCFRIIQEAVTNALKHSGAGKIRVSTTRLEHNLEIAISDNGKGFAGESDANGIGFSLMRERIRGLRGHLFVNSSALGVELHVLIPAQKTGS